MEFGAMFIKKKLEEFPEIANLVQIEVIDDRPAKAAGMKSGDRIVSVAGMLISVIGVILVMRSPKTGDRPRFST